MRVRGRWSPIGALGLAAAACAASATVQLEPAVATPAAGPPAPVTGTVVDKRGLPLPDQIVAIGAVKTTSDVDGRFTFPAVPDRYDLMIASPEGALATVYQGVTRRDPIIPFEGAPAREPKHNAEIAVTLVGADAALARSWQVHFVSARAFASIREKPWAADGDKLRNPDALVVKWHGAADVITGVVIAQAMQVKQVDIPLVQFAQQAVSVRDGQKLAMELRVAKAPVVRRPGPVVQVPKEDPGFDPMFIEEYRLPGVGFAMNGPGAVSSAYDIPDLTGFGLQLCGDGFQWNPYLHSRRIQCGAPPGKRVVLVLPRPPALTSPAWDTVATPGMAFTWAPVAGAVYALELASNGASKPTAARPHIAIVTAGTRAVWPDLQFVGVGFPRPLAAYAATITARGPFAAVDDLIGPHGLADQTPRDRWASESKELSIPVRSPLGKEEAACKFKETVICGQGGGDLDNPLGEFYRLSVLNRTIQTYPDFAAAVKIHCVRDCAGARAYLKAYRAYSAAHPGFDQDQPLSVASPDEPEPPPEMFQGHKRAFSGED